MPAQSALCQAWSDYTASAASTDAGALTAASVDRQLRAACLREALAGLDAAARRGLVDRGLWTEETAARIDTVAGWSDASAAGAATPPASEPDALLAAGLRSLPWDLVYFAAERFVWLLPAGERNEALSTFARAHASLPMPQIEDSAAHEARRLARALARDPSPQRQEKFLQAASGVVEGEVRSQVLLHVIPLLTGERREQALQDALAGAYEFPEGEIHRGQIVAAVVLRDPRALLDGVLETVQATWDDEDTRAELLTELARALSAEDLGSVVEQAAALEDEWGRVGVLAELRPRLPLELQGRWQQLADAIEEESLKDMLEPLPVEPPPLPSDETALADALRDWLTVANARRSEPGSIEIARGVVSFLAATTELYDAHHEA